MIAGSIGFRIRRLTGSTSFTSPMNSGTRGHPAMQSVELRLMPAAGGEPKTLLGMTGGQGTMNVPCWAPDSRKFAFVSYEN